MKIEGDTKFIGTIDDSILQPLREKCFIVDWMHDKFSRHEPVLSTGRLCTLPYFLRRPEQRTYNTEQEELIEVALPIVDEVLTHFPDLVPIRGEIVNLLPGRELTLHVDVFWFHKHSKRIHVPIYTNIDCVQIFEDREIHLSVGNIYEINNRILHSARNNGKEPRFHLILDLIDKENYEIALSDKLKAISEVL